MDTSFRTPTTAFGEKPDPTLPTATALELMETEILIHTGQRLV
jgi:hypothetical protein